jgi:hypothetical protein
MKPPPRPPRPPYWILVALVGLLTLPFTWALAAMAAAATAQVALAVARRSKSLQARPATGTRAGAGAGIRLGVDERGRDVVLSDRQLAAHGLIVGASGAGKSNTLLHILCDRVERGLPVVAIDLKGSPEFARRLEQAAARAGRPFRIWTPDGPAHWNPLAHGNATELKDKLVGTERFTEPHYERAAERYIQTALQVLHAAGRQPQLADVVELMEPKRLAAMARQIEPALAARVHDYLGGMTRDQLSAVHGLGTRLALLSESTAGPYLARRRGGAGVEVDLPRALEGPEVVLFSLNSGIYGKLAGQLATLAIQDLTSATGHRLQRMQAGESVPQAIVGIDEFSAIGADHVINLFARGREGGVCMLTATQEFTDLDRAGRGFRDQVLGIVGLKIVHRQDVPASARVVAEMAGTEWAWDVTRQIRSPFAAGQGSRGTRRLVERFVVHPNEIKALEPGQAVMLSKLPQAQVIRSRVSAPPPVAPPARAAPSEPSGPQPTAPAPPRGHGRSAPRRSGPGLGRGDQPDPGVTR